MYKSEAIQATLDHKKVCHEKCAYEWIMWHGTFNRWEENDGNEFIWMERDPTEGWQIYEEPEEEWHLWQRGCGKKMPKKGTYKGLQCYDGKASKDWYECHGICDDGDVYRYKRVNK